MIVGTIVTVVGSDLKNGHTVSCGCIKSKGEEKIASILKELQIDFEKEKIFSSCKSNYNNIPYRFDFYLPLLNIIIEYDGRQHFDFDKSGGNTEENYKKTINRDVFKNQGCKENNYKLIRIPYQNFDILNIEYMRGILNE